MNALILSAGLGTRLRPLTNRVPKPMIEVAGRPVLEHLIFHLHKFGIRNIILNLHYLPLKIMQHFGSSVLYTYENELLGEERTIQTIAKNFPFISQSYLVVMNGDTLTNIDLSMMFELSQGDSIKSMDGKIYTGTKILSPNYFKGKKRINTFHSSETWWFDIGTPEGLTKARKFYE